MFVFSKHNVEKENRHQKEQGAVDENIKDRDAP